MKFRVICLVLIVLLLLPTVALAGFDEYGYNAKACKFSGTLDNWEAFIYGLPPLPQVDRKATDVMFVERKWNKAFNDGMFLGKPLVNGAWCASQIYMNLSGEQLGWTWHWHFTFVYSDKPVPSGIAVPEMPGFYFIEDRAWLADPKGNTYYESDFRANPAGRGYGLFK